MRKGNILENDDRMLCRILFQQILEVWRAGTEDHLVSLGMLTLMYLPRQCMHQRPQTEND